MQRRTLLASLATLAVPGARARASSRIVVTRDHLQLACLDRGAGRPVVLVHGWSLSSAIWTLQTDALAAQGVRVIAYDRRGHGASDKPDDGYDMDRLADDLAAVFEHLDVRDAVLVGHSMGAGEVVRYLARHGTQRVGRVVLVTPTTPFALKTVDNPEGTDRAFYDKAVAAIEADRAAYLRAGAPGFFGSGAASELIDWGLDIALQAAPQAQVKCLRALSETDFRPDLGALALPALVICGSADAPDMVRNATRTAAAIAGSRLATYEGAPHGLFLTDPARFNRDLLEFARS